MTFAVWSCLVTFGPAALALAFLCGHLHGRIAGRRKKNYAGESPKDW